MGAMWHKNTNYCISIRYDLPVFLIYQHIDLAYDFNNQIFECHV